MHKRLVILALLALVSLRCFADDDTAPDPIRDALDKAKTTYAETIEKAKADLHSAFDSQIKEVAKTGTLEHVKSLQAEQTAFDLDGKLPTSQPMKKAAIDYRMTMDKAHTALVTDYETAVSDYTKKLQIDKADRVNNEFDAFKKELSAKPSVILPSATAVKKPQFEYEFFEWNMGDAPKKMIQKDEGFCYLVGIAGAFHGGGEQAHVDIKDDGYWYLWGNSQAGGMSLKAVAVKINRAAPALSDAAGTSKSDEATSILGADRLKQMLTSKTWYFHWEEQPPNRDHLLRFLPNGHIEGYPANSDWSIERLFVVKLANSYLIQTDDNNFRGFFISTGRQVGIFSDAK